MLNKFYLKCGLPFSNSKGCTAPVGRVNLIAPIRTRIKRKVGKPPPLSFYVLAGTFLHEG